MSDLTLELTDGRTEFLPGETIEGTARWRLDEPAEGLEIRLFWYTEGKGDRDVGGNEAVVIDSAGTEGRHEFSFSAPAAPHSFSGSLISLIWAVELVVLPSGDAARQELVVSPSSREIRLSPVDEEDEAGLSIGQGLE